MIHAEQAAFVTIESRKNNQKKLDEELDEVLARANSKITLAANDGLTRVQFEYAGNSLSVIAKLRLHLQKKGYTTQGTTMAVFWIDWGYLVK
jgi:hypothetical protein